MDDNREAWKGNEGSRDGHDNEIIVSFQKIVRN